MVHVRDAYSEFRAAGADVTVIAMGSVAEVAAFRTRYELPFRFLADAEQSAYRLFGLRRGGIGAVAGPRMWARGWKALLTHGVGKVNADPYQLPGSFVIDRDGTIRFAHYAATSADWASNEQLLNVVHTLAAREPAPG